MKILVTPTLCVPSYFNAGHRLPLFEVAGYLRKKGHIVEVRDIAALNFTWKDLADLLVQKKFDVIAIMNDFDLVEGFGRFIKYVQEFSPETYIVTFGRLSASHGGFFEQYPIDGIVKSGDYETGVLEFIKYLQFGIMPAGVIIRQQEDWINHNSTGILLSPDEWVLPNINEICYQHYDTLYGTDQRKYCGIPQRRELVIPVARGCPLACNFCEVWQREGRKERRLTIKEVLQYIEDSFKSHPFEYISMYAPTFTLKRQWVIDLCNSFIDQGSLYPWKCTTTMFHLDEELVVKMAQSGCVRISIGLESLEDSGVEALPGQKHSPKQRFDQLLSWCKKTGIELNCFIIIGLPGTTVSGTKEMIEYLRSCQVRIRPSIYSDYSMLSANMSEQEALGILSRHFLPSSSEFSLQDRLSLYDIVFGLEPNPTKIMDLIPKH